MNSKDTDRTLPSQWLILIALLQGLALLLLHQAIEFKVWPHDQPQWLFSFYSVAVVGPLMLLLALEKGNTLRLISWILPFTLLAATLGYYIGWQASPWEYIDPFSLLFCYVSTLTLLTFKVLLHAQSHITHATFHYSALFRFSWRNFFTLSLSLLFMGLVWGALMLWAALFKAIDIDFFYDLFTESWFYYPALALSHGFGVLIFRRQITVIDTITALLQALMKFLLVLLVIVGILFLTTLLFTGLAPLWGTGKGSTLILCLQALMLFTLNGVYQDNTEARPYPLWLHRLIYVGIALLPIYSAISFYGLSLRVDQYGWTVSRLWGYFIWAFLAALSLGYLVSIVRLRDRWLELLSRVNIGMGLALIAGLTLANTPLLDFRKITTSSQINRFHAGESELNRWDLLHFRRQLGRPGYLALQQLREEIKDEQPDVALRITSTYRDRSHRIPQAEFDGPAFLLLLRQHHHGDIPEEVIDHVLNWAEKSLRNPQDVQSAHLIPADMNNDGQAEYVLIVVREWWNTAMLFHPAEDGWKATAMGIISIGTNKEHDALTLGLTTGDITPQEPTWRELRIGDDIILRARSD